MLKKSAVFILCLLFAAPLRADEAVTEIALSRSACYGRCPVYTITLTPGEAVYEGEKYVEKTGTYRAMLDPAVFLRLAALLNENNFFLLKESYEVNATGLPAVYTSVVSRGNRKTVRNYGDGGPHSLHAIETAIDEAADKLDWQKLDEDIE